MYRCQGIQVPGLILDHEIQDVAAPLGNRAPEVDLALVINKGGFTDNVFACKGTLPYHVCQVPCNP